MIYVTHAFFSIFLSLIIAEVAHFPMHLTIFSVLGSLIPDIDEEKSFAGRVLIPLSGLVSMFGHRGVTHSLLGSVVFSLPLLLIGRETALFFFFGWLSHIIADSLNPSGVPFFFPFKKRYSFARIKSGSKQEIVCFLLPLVIADVVLMLISE
ncbi:MAG: hypothetical protein DRP11_02655 [Candidatus Aenigmatarchaeota archaeon]|nr:MAG: hypothetical protein DRP11_02655 [Candidatus Aenigmarchaeota archaeon]